MWVVVTSVEPLRAYLFKGGVLPFGTLKDAPPASATCSADGALIPSHQSVPAEAVRCSVVFPEETRLSPMRQTSVLPCAGEASLADEGCTAGADSGYAEGDDLIVNLWRNRGDAVIWSVAQFEKHLLATTGTQQAFQGLWTALQGSIGVHFILVMYRRPCHPSVCATALKSSSCLLRSHSCRCCR